MAIFKTLVRVTVISVVVAGAAILIAGPHRTAAMVGKAHGAVMSAIDENIDDPTALRAQLHDLQEQYPERIADLRGDLAELEEQMNQIERDRQVAERVVALTNSDLTELQPLIAQAETASAQAGYGNIVRVRFANTRLDIDQAYQRADQIRRTQAAYSSRAADAVRDLGYLQQQAGRLRTLLGQLETERAEFQAQVWQLDRQVDAIARNDRLIEMMEKRQATIAECSRYEGVSLDKLQARFAEVRSRQEVELEILASDQQRLDYEDVARIQLDGEMRSGASEPGIEFGVNGDDGTIVMPAIDVTPSEGPRLR